MIVYDTLGMELREERMDRHVRYPLPQETPPSTNLLEYLLILMDWSYDATYT
jgi:hypothetical protein